jgi:membrane-associated phospholipid phosphatase
MRGDDYRLNIATAGNSRLSWRFRNPVADSGTVGSSRSRVLFLPSLFVLTAVAALAVDCQISQWCLQQQIPREVNRLLNIGEMCAHGLGVLVIGIAIFHLDHQRRRFVPHVLVAAWGAGIVANVLKLLVARVRPHSFDFQGDVWSTFTALFPFLEGGSSAQSFPSAHTAAAAGLAVVLGHLYPHAKWFFVVLAVLAACQRVQSGAHYLSDVLAGAAVGMVFASWILRTKWLSIPV